MHDVKASRPIHICQSSDCDCGMSRRDFLRLSALTAASVAAPLLSAGDARAQGSGSDVPVKIGYLPITDATPLLVAHGRKLFEAEGLTVEKPRLFRTWAQIVEAFVAGQVNVIHLLSPATLWVRYGTRFPAKVVAWNHVNGSALTVAPTINSVADLGGKTVAIPFWYSIHNVILQQLLQANGLTPVTRARDAGVARNEVNLVVLPPAEMVSALAGKSIAGFIVAEPFNAAAETAGIGKVLATTDYASYEASGAARNKGWYQRRIDFQPYPFASYTEELVKVLQKTKLEGDNAFLQKLDPRFAARDLVDERFVRRAINAVGGPSAFGLPADLLRKEVLAV